MDFRDELCILSEQNGSKKNKRSKTYKKFKKVLKDFSEKTGEKGINIFFDGYSDKSIKKIKEQAEEDGLEFIWYTKGAKGAQNDLAPFGIIAWDTNSFLSKYPFKVSFYAVLCTKDGAEISVEWFDTRKGDKE